MTDPDITALLRESAADYLAGRAARQPAPGAVPPFDRQGWREMGELGWLGIVLPEAAGGAGLGLGEATILSEQFGRAPADVSWLAASLLPSLLLAEVPASVGAAALAAMAVSGARPLALAWQEQAGQPDLQPPAATCDGARLTGVKRFVPCVADDAVVLVSAMRGDDPVWVAVEAGAEGVTLESHAAGLGSEATLRFDGAPVSHELARGAAATRALALALEAGRIALAAQLAGIAAGVLEKTLAYVGDRVQFDKPISAFQVIRHRCVDLHIAVQLAQASWRHALRCHERDPLSDTAARAVSAAKARCGDVAFQAGKEAVQMHGGMGFTEECGVGAYLRAALHGRAWLGSPMAHRRRFIAPAPFLSEQAHVH